MKTIWVCMACGKVSKDRYGKEGTTPGWDESCFINSVLVKEDHLVWKDDRVNDIKEGGIIQKNLKPKKKKWSFEFEKHPHYVVKNKGQIVMTGQSKTLAIKMVRAFKDIKNYR
jgi:hypothetical protein